MTWFINESSGGKSVANHLNLFSGENCPRHFPAALPNRVPRADREEVPAPDLPRLPSHWKVSSIHARHESCLDRGNDTRFARHIQVRYFQKSDLI